MRPCTLYLLSSAAALALASCAAPPVTLRVLDGQPVDPYLFGYNAEAYIGITLNKLLNDTAGIAAAKALHAGVFRYPGGTLSNTWNPMSGQYVEPAPFPGGKYPSGYDKWQVWGRQLNSKYPKGTFSAEQYLQDGNLGSVTKRTLWCLNVYSFNLSQTCEQIAYIGSLPGQQAPGVVLELGNELYIGNQGGPKFPNSESYGLQMADVLKCTRQHMPHATVAAVGAPGKWNQGLKASAHLFDAVSWHAYQPNGDSVNWGGHNNLTSLVDRVSHVAGYGRAVSAQTVAQQKAELGVAKPIAHTEFGFGLDKPGHCVLGSVPGINGALHGAFHVSRILFAINNPGTYAAITLESFVGGTPVAGPNVPVDPQAGNRTDYWCGLAASTVPTFHSNRPDLARIAGTGQVFSHFAATAFRSGTMQQRPVAVDNGPTLPFSILGQGEQPCLQAAAFSEPPTDEHASSANAPAVIMSVSVLNICNRTVDAAVQVKGAKTAQATFYSLLDGGRVDPGPLNQKGWAPLPSQPDELPWKDGPLQPSTASFAANPASGVSIGLPGLSFAVVDVLSG